MVYKINDRIVVTTRVGKYKKFDLLHQHGTIVGYYKEFFKVRIDNINNTRSADGVFYLTSHTFKREDASEQDIESEVTIMDGNYRAVRVAFLDNPGKLHMYACYDDNVKIGDVCMVKSKTHGFGLAEIVAFVDDYTEPLVREIVARIDMTAYIDRVAQRKLKAELRQKMEERAAKLQEIALYELLAKEDAEMAELLKEYKGV